ncbi:MAG TPA: ABC transporter substrate-binding protein, partial [Treponemataceae bacterium]|nr:ABC transporter substrate-binding protein [Treponemataceae bacterium]
NAIEFDLSVVSDNAIIGDISSIIVDECKKVGITVNVRATDFQKLVEDLTSTYGWQSLIIGLGANYWPTQGSNVWPTTGNLHLWYPLQKKPATDWEARVDWLYNEGSYTIDRAKAARYWDEYQRILLEQCPLIYLVRPQSFVALRNRWDFANVYFDNIGGFEMSHISLRP